MISPPCIYPCSVLDRHCRSHFKVLLDRHLLSLAYASACAVIPDWPAFHRKSSKVPEEGSGVRLAGSNEYCAPESGICTSVVFAMFVGGGAILLKLSLAPLLAGYMSGVDCFVVHRPLIRRAKGDRKHYISSSIVLCLRNSANGTICNITIGIPFLPNLQPPPDGLIL